MTWQNKQVIFSSVLTAAAVIALSLVGMTVLAEDVHTNHKICIYSMCDSEDHQEVEWIKWESSDSLPTESGNYYLSADISPTDPDYLPEIKQNTEISLCLKGHSINVCLSVNGTLNLCDCESVRPKGKIKGVSVSSTGSFNMYGGVVSQTEKKTGVKNAGIFKMYGGEISGNNNEATRFGGGIYNADTGTAAIYGGSIKYNQSLFAFGESRLGCGGGIYNEGKLTIEEGIIISDNAANFQGGGIYNGTNGELVIKRSLIYQNTSYHGGGIFNEGTLKIEGASISENTADSYGGGIYTNKEITITGGNISSNRSQMGGGGILTSGTLTMENCIVSNNFSTYNGGGIYSYKELIIKNCSITSNDSKGAGGGIISYGNLTAEDSIVSNNSASHGGGIYTDGTGEGLIFNISGSSINNNTAVFNGGGIHSNVISDIPAYISDSEISGNKADYHGGGIFLDLNCSLELMNVSVRENRTAKSGSGIFIDARTTLNISAGSINNNTADLYGGGIYSQGSVNISDAEISGNKAVGGGGIYNESDSPLTLKNSTVSQNTAVTEDGGGIYSCGEAEIWDTEISGNEAQRNGGGIYLGDLECGLKLNGGTISENKAADGTGGGIYDKAQKLIITQQVIITGNEADSGSRNNLFLADDSFIYIEEQFNTESEIGITPESVPECGSFRYIVYNAYDEEYIPAFCYDGTEERIQILWYENALKLGNNHDLTNYPAEEPNCIKDGNIEYDLCSICKKVFFLNGGVQMTEPLNDSTLNNYIKRPATGRHQETLTPIGYQAPTCTEKGHKEYWLCELCGSKFGSPEGGGIIYDDDIELAAEGHNMIHHEVSLPTCTEEGVIEYWECTKCGCRFSDQEGKNALTDDVTIPKAEHTLSCIEAKEPTCTEKGNREYRQCSVCGGKFSDDKGENPLTDEETIIPAKGHTLSCIEAKEPTCTEIGNREYLQCSVCGEKFSDDKGENPLTDEETEIPAKGHDLDHIELKEPTCTEAGNKEYWQCSRCGEKFSDKDGENLITDDITISAKGHSLKRYEEKKPTCTEDGHKEYWECTVCNAIFADDKGAEIADDIVIPAVGHNWKTECDGDCHRNVCTVCGYIDTDSIEKHNYDGGIITKPSTCTDEGEITYTCTDCGHTKSETMRKLSHDVMEELQYNQDSHWEECRICRQHLHEAPHTWDEGTENPEEHIKVYSCEICGAKKTEAFEPAPDTTPTEETLPESSEPEETLTESTEPEVTLPESTEPEETLPESTEPEETLPESTEPEETLPESTEPEETLPESTEPEETLPESTEPEETLPESTEAEETLPEGTEPEETEQKTTKREESTFTESTAKEETQAGTAATDSGNNTDDGKDEGNMPTGMVISVIPAITALAAAVILKRKR